MITNIERYLAEQRAADQMNKKQRHDWWRKIRRQRQRVRRGLPLTHGKVEAWHLRDAAPFNSEWNRVLTVDEAIGEEA